MNRWLFVILVLITTSLMGSSFAIGKVGLHYISPLLLVGVRFTLAGILMAVSVIKRDHPKTLEAWLKIALIGLLQTGGVMGCIFISLRTIAASESSILTFMNPLLVIILGTLFTGARYRLLQWGESCSRIPRCFRYAWVSFTSWIWNMARFPRGSILGACNTANQALGSAHGHMGIDGLPDVVWRYTPARCRCDH